MTNLRMIVAMSLLCGALVAAPGCDCGGVPVGWSDDDGGAPNETVQTDGGGAVGCVDDQDCAPSEICRSGACVPNDGTDGGSDAGPGEGTDGGTGEPNDGGANDDGDAGTGDGQDGGSDDPADGGSGGGDGGSSGGCVDVCHVPPGNPENAHVICVDPSAVDALLEHGDTLGACPGADPDGGGGASGDPDGGPGEGTDAGSHSCGDGKALICHVPPGNPENAHDICVGSPASGAHLDHGDSLGSCGD